MTAIIGTMTIAALAFGLSYGLYRLELLMSR